MNIDPVLQNNIPDEALRDAYLRHVDNLQAARKSSFEAYDKAVLNLSSAGLGLSLGFAQTMLNKKILIHEQMLFCSWFLFIGAIVCTLLSFVLATLALDKEIEIAGQYYIDGNNEAYSKRHCLTKATGISNTISGLLFVTAIFLTTFFYITNLKGEFMNEQNNQFKKGVIREDGYVASQLPRLSGNGTKEVVTKGATSGNPPRIRTTTSSTTQTAPQPKPEK